MSDKWLVETVTAEPCDHVGERHSSKCPYCQIKQLTAEIQQLQRQWKFEQDLRVSVEKRFDALHDAAGDYLYDSSKRQVLHDEYLKSTASDKQNSGVSPSPEGTRSDPLKPLTPDADRRECNHPENTNGKHLWQTISLGDQSATYCMYCDEPKPADRDVDSQWKDRAKELAETVALRFDIEAVPGQEFQSVLYYLRSLPTNDRGVYVHLVGHSVGDHLKEQEIAEMRGRCHHFRKQTHGDGSAKCLGCGQTWPAPVATSRERTITMHDEVGDISEEAWDELNDFGPDGRDDAP